MGTGRTKKSLKGKGTNKLVEEIREERPDANRWRRMQVYKSFVVSDKDGNQHKFESGDDVIILPHGFDPTVQHSLETYWVGRIKEIRAENFDDESNSVWARVQWYYSGTDTAGAIGSFDPRTVGKFERVLSDHYDFVESESFEDRIKIYKLDENDDQQGFIPNDCFYSRYNLEYSRRLLTPKPGSSSCYDDCKKPYNPNDVSVESTMHFCPRPACRKGYHHGCLLAKNCVEDASGVLRPKPTVKIPVFSKSLDEDNGSTVVVKSRAARKQTTSRNPKSMVTRPMNLRKTLSQKEREEEDETREILIPSQESLSELVLYPISTTHMVLSVRHLRLLSSSPDVDGSVDLNSFIPPTSANPCATDIDLDDPCGDNNPEDEDLPKRRRGRPPKKASTARKSTQRLVSSTRSKSRASLSSILSALPCDLLEIATQPQVRGGAFSKGGPAGNIGMVTQARRLVYTALQMGGGTESTAGWEEEVFGSDQETTGAKKENAIVLLDLDEEGRSTERRTRARGVEGEVDLPQFVCPTCGSAI